jgi:hypothetical protein
MICPHCSTSVKFEWNYGSPIKKVGKQGYFIIYDTCPNCEDSVIYYSLCNYNNEKGYSAISIRKGTNEMDIVSEELIYPRRNNYQQFEIIPEKYFEDYEESLRVLTASPKAAAALSRRLLQLILRDEYGIKKRSLSDEIEAFINLDGIPTHLTDAIDAIRQIGNLAAHPIKNTNTGEIVAVEPGEAEWLIEVIEALFDFCFIQPIKLKQRREELNKKLEELGKPPMKEKKDQSTGNIPSFRSA